MQLTWYGQAAFRLVDETGYRVIRDPDEPELLGFPPIVDECDLVITSSANDRAHCRHDPVRLPGVEHFLVRADPASVDRAHAASVSITPDAPPSSRRVPVAEQHLPG